MVTKLKILGSGKEVGRAAIVVEYNGRGVMLDYGVNFDENDNPVMPLSYPPNRLDALVLSHVHLDHIGAAPLLYSSVAPRAFSTRLTRYLSRLMLEDFLKLSGYYLDFEINEVNTLLSHIEDISHGSKVRVGEFEIEFFHSGHIPGSVATKVSTPEGSILYTSDINTIDTKLVTGARLDGVEAETLIIESTYGNADHPSRENVEKRFIDSVKETLSMGGTVLVPVFSVGRGQEVMAILEENEISPVYVDGMVRSATEIMLENSEFLRDPSILRRARENQIFLSNWQDRRSAWKKGGVIVSSSGMLKGGPSRYFLRKIHDNPRNAVFLVSYQGRGTPGRMLIEKGMFEEGGPQIKARLEWMDFSSHAGRSGLVEVLKSVRGIERVVLVHGEESVQKEFAEMVKENLGIEPLIPTTGEVIDLKVP
ncbi:MAG: MBL fold metallo-hydrolase [Fervidicoccaceae archaeon]|jgi:putative mRNA 3-end processing factor